MTFSVDVVLKGRDFAVTETVVLAPGQPAAWTDDVVREILVEVLRAIDRVQHPGADRERPIVLHGFSWIVEPEEKGVVIAIEIPMGAAVAGPFAVSQQELDAAITRVLQNERQMFAPRTVH
jgi:hypothetical protein